MDREFFSIGPITIYWYSIAILLAVLTGTYLSIIESKKVGMKTYVEDLLFKMILIGIVGARAYYVIFNFKVYKNNILDIFKIWEGGIAIYGAILAGLLVIVFSAKKNNKSITSITDIFTPGLIIAQAIGRWGNFFNQEAYGTAVSLAFLEKLHLPHFIIEGMNIDGVYHHPTFLYESLWCLLGFIILIIIRKTTNRKEGIVTYTYFIWYGIGRYLIEGLRTDSLYLGGIRISQLVSIVLIIVGIIGIIKKIIKKST